MGKTGPRSYAIGILGLSAAWLWGCGHGAPGGGQAAVLLRAQAAIAAAQAACAASDNLPALHLQLAREALAEGQRLQAAAPACPPQAAVAALLRAEMDARLALALVQETAARAREEELHDRLTDLQHHLQVSGLAIDTEFEGPE